MSCDDTVPCSPVVGGKKPTTAAAKGFERERNAFLLVYDRVTDGLPTHSPDDADESKRA